MPPSDVVLPEELSAALAREPALAEIFAALPASHRREYATWVDAAKKPETRAQRAEKTLAMLGKKQLPDGGWSTRRMSDLLKWRLEVHPATLRQPWKEAMDPTVVALIRNLPDAANPGSDPYMTAFAIVLLRESGVPASDPRIQRGITWLKENQRVTGRWWMHSLYRGNYNYITYIATAQALRALALCDELPATTSR